MVKRVFLFLLFTLSFRCFAVDIQEDIIKKGTELLGTPYRYGGMTPSGFDCSGLVNYLYKPFIPSLPRTASALSSVGTSVPLSDIFMGDLVFYATGTDSNEITHVGIYIGQNTLIQAVSAGPKRGVILTDLDEKYWKTRFKWIKRVFPGVADEEIKTITAEYSRGTYEGEAAANEPQGEGSMRLENGDLYEGHFKDGVFHGLGKYRYANGDVYIGQFYEGRESGGELIRSDGSRYSAERNEAGILIINDRPDQSESRDNHLLEVPDDWDEWFQYEMERFEASRKGEEEALSDEMKRFEEWKKNN